VSAALRILAVAGCRPNFVKLGPLLRETARRPEIETVLVHTGQHYDRRMSEGFFRDLELPEPDVGLEVGSGAHASQTARLMAAMEGTLLDQAPDLALVVGDVNSPVAAALTAVKLGVPVAHVEAGLRSFDRQMPEEVNRVVTDSISELLFASEPSAVDNLRREGVAGDRVRLVGNVMVDALLGSLDRLPADPAALHGLAAGGYAVATLHRPENVDDPETAAGLVSAIETLQRWLPIVFPVHPRTRERLERMELWQRLAGCPGLRPTEPLGYLEFLGLVRDAALVLTDSGGLQEETTTLGVPCLTLRDSTERPATVDHGTNRVVGRRPEAIVEAALEALGALDGDRPQAPPRRPELWDGLASRRIVEVLVDRADHLKSLYPRLRERTPWRSKPVSTC
jgi:UDP-N-acetylglucosamine 2-epimerase (non-hydrolysing)